MQTTRSGYEKKGAPIRPEKPPTAEKPRKKPPPVPPKFSSRSPADQLDTHFHDGEKNSPIVSMGGSTNGGGSGDGNGFWKKKKMPFFFSFFFLN